MNIYFSQVEKRSQLFSYFLAAFAICTLMLLTLSFSHFFADRRSMSSRASGVVHTESANVPVAVRAPLPPQDQIQGSIPPLSSGSMHPVPQVVPVPSPSVP